MIGLQPGILVVRFMFNLRDLSEQAAEESLSRFSDAGFAMPSRYLGNIGEALEHWQTHDSSLEDTSATLARPSEGDYPPETLLAQSPPPKDEAESVCE